MTSTILLPILLRAPQPLSHRVIQSVSWSVGPSVRQSVTLCFFCFLLFCFKVRKVSIWACPCQNHYYPCPAHYCSCPTARRVYSLVSKYCNLFVPVDVRYIKFCEKSFFFWLPVFATLLPIKHWKLHLLKLVWEFSICKNRFFCFKNLQKKTLQTIGYYGTHHKVWFFFFFGKC